MADKPSVFISYSHRDTQWKDRFVRHLNVSVKQGHFVQWNDEQIGAGEDWYAKISAAMDAASVGVFLISVDFLGSDFILREEVTRLIERREREGLCIVPVYLHKCDWEAVKWLAQMQIRPAGDRWISPARTMPPMRISPTLPKRSGCSCSHPSRPRPIARPAG
jgi:hypothetical protein